MASHDVGSLEKATKKGKQWTCTRCDTVNSNARYGCKVCGRAGATGGKDGENDNEMEIDSVVSEDSEWARTKPHKRESEALMKNHEKDKEIRGKSRAEGRRVRQRE